MARIALKGETVNTRGELPPVGGVAPDFRLTKRDLSDVTRDDFKGRKLVISIFPSIDTPVCATSVHRFNAEVNTYEDTAVLCVSRDLPFAHDRFCKAEGIDNVLNVSELRSREFGRTYGVEITTGPLAGLLAQAVVVLDPAGRVVYTQLVDDIADEPDYGAVLDALRRPAPSTDAPLEACLQPFDPESARMDQTDEPCNDGRAG